MALFAFPVALWVLHLLWQIYSAFFEERPFLWTLGIAGFGCAGLWLLVGFVRFSWQMWGSLFS